MKPIKPQVCESLLLDSDWVIEGCHLRRGCVYVCTYSGEITVDAANVPLSWGERRCVKKCARKRLEKVFRAAGRDFKLKGHA